ncbi:MAG: hypothetical protein ACOCQD_02770 [archaeon]
MNFNSKQIDKIKKEATPIVKANRKKADQELESNLQTIHQILTLQDEEMNPNFKPCLCVWKNRVYVKYRKEVKPISLIIPKTMLSSSTQKFVKVFEREDKSYYICVDTAVRERIISHIEEMKRTVWN